MSNKRLNEPPSILFVCIGNICRSPACEAICRYVLHKSSNAKISSAAMTEFHLNEPPDGRLQDICLKKGIDISNYRAKQIKQNDWYTYKYIVALDSSIYNFLENKKPSDSTAKILLFNAPNGILDPYYGGKLAFYKMFEEIQMSMKPFLEQHKIM